MGLKNRCIVISIAIISIFFELFLSQTAKSIKLPITVKYLQFYELKKPIPNKLQACNEVYSKNIKLALSAIKHYTKSSINIVLPCLMQVDLIAVGIAQVTLILNNTKKSTKSVFSVQFSGLF